MVDGYVSPLELPQRRLEELRRVLADLDRCPHGRHEGDACAGFRPGEPMSGCEGGWSRGNPLMPTGMRVGTSVYGDPIWMPPREQRHDPAAWRRPWKPDAEGLVDAAAAKALGEPVEVIRLRRGLGVSYHAVGNHIYGHGVQVWEGDTLVGLQPVDGCMSPIGSYQVLADGSVAHVQELPGRADG
jgi:hypothetical protein